MLADMMMGGELPLIVQKAEPAAFEIRITGIDSYFKKLVDLCWQKEDTVDLMEWVQTSVQPYAMQFAEKYGQESFLFGMVRIVYPKGEEILMTGLADLRLADQITSGYTGDPVVDFELFSKMPVSISCNFQEPRVE